MTCLVQVFPIPRCGGLQILPKDMDLEAARRRDDSRNSWEDTF
jgi:hypothetical protein